VIVVADTSVILNLACVGRADLLQQLYREVWIPQKVAEEFGWQTCVNPRFHGLQLPSWAQIRGPMAIPEKLRSHESLDDGEREALALALEIRADAILIDEENGREVATELGLRRIGILGILLRAREQGLIPTLKPILNTLKNDANFWISEPLYEHILKQAGEQA
jgi:predicted nucleic acid-binding protein